MDKRRTGYIYRIYSTDEDFDEKDSYYGSAWNVELRFNKHFQEWNQGINGCRSIYLFNKYDNVKYEIIETLENVNEKERISREINNHILVKPCINFIGKTGLAYKDLSERDYKKGWYNLNLEKIKKYRSTKHNCNCGRHYDNSHKQAHLRSEIHNKLIELKNKT